jgi:deazaflavin-dependent oxidoreductase (nitroreductase family)
MDWLAAHVGTECCDVATTGRRTGRPHEIEIWFGVVGATMYLISGNGPMADWFRNIEADPAVTVHLAGERHEGRARVVVDPAERRLAGDVMGQKYRWGGDPSIGLTYEAWCYDVPAVAVEFGAAPPR